jgi:hypothetical protein
MDELAVPVRRIKRFWLAAVLFLGLAGMGGAGGGPENVVVVVNPDSPASLRVANEYIHLRRVPPRNVIYLSGIPREHTIGVKEFRQRILRPLVKIVNERGLGGQIDCVAYSAGFPYRVNVKSDIGERKLHKLLTQPASITGLTYLYQLVLGKPPSYLSLRSNGYVRRPLRQAEWGRWEDREKWEYREVLKLFAEFKKVRKQLGKNPSSGDLIGRKKAILGKAEKALSSLASAHPKNQEVQYNLACVLALQGRSGEALDHLGAAVDAGWWNTAHTRRDPDLKSLHGLERFGELLDAMQGMEVPLQPTMAFRSGYAFKLSGEVVSQEEGISYLLCTMLAHVGPRSNTLGEALESLRRSVGADGSRPEGTVYYMKNKDIRSRVRQWGFHPARNALKKLGVAAEILEGKLPRKKADVIGAMVGTARFDWTGSESTIRAGAICEHLTSMGGVMSGAGQTLLSEWIRAGAAGSSGTVTEPYGIQAKFPSPFIHVHYVRGASLAEAFYQSVQGPYQLLIVGDPLCRPWARFPDVHLDGIGRNVEVSGTLKLTPRAEVPRECELRWFELFVDGKRLKRVRPGQGIDLHTDSLYEGWHELRLVAVISPLQTQGRTIIPFRVDRGGPPLTIREAPTGTVVASENIAISAGLKGAERISIHHNAREVGGVEGESGTVKIDPKLLGAGPVSLRPVAHKAGRTVTGPPVVFTIQRAERAASAR